MLGYLIVKEGDGVVGVRPTAEDAAEYVEFLLVTDPDPEASFSIKKITS